MERVNAFLKRGLRSEEDRERCLYYIRHCAGLERDEVAWAEGMLDRQLAEYTRRPLRSQQRAPGPVFSEPEAAVVRFMLGSLCCAEDRDVCLRFIQRAGLTAPEEARMVELLNHWIFVGHFTPHDERHGADADEYPAYRELVPWPPRG